MYVVPYILSQAGGGSQLKAIQSGTVTFNTGNTSQNVSIAAVTLNKAFLIFNLYSNGDFGTPSIQLVRGKLNSTTQIQFNRNSSGADVFIQWWVVEFSASSGVVVQRGTNTLSSNPLNVSITSAALANSFPLISLESSNANLDTNDTVTAELTTTTNLQFQSASINSQVIDWQVITNPQWTVAKYTDTNIGTTQNTTISAVNLAAAWLVSSVRYSASAFLTGNKIPHCKLTSSTNIQLVQIVAAPTQSMVYYVITSNKFQSQHFTMSIPNGNGTNTQAITAVTTANSFIYLAGAFVYAFLNTGGVSNRGTRIYTRLGFNSATQILATRGSATESVQFTPSIQDFTNV